MKVIYIDVHQATTEDHQDVDGHAAEDLHVVDENDAEHLHVDVPNVRVLNIVVYHAELAGKLGCLKLKLSGLICWLRDIATIYTLAEFTSDLVLSKYEKASGIIVLHAGVAVKATFYMVKP